MLALALVAACDLDDIYRIDIEAPEVCAVDVSVEFIPGTPTSFTRDFTRDDFFEPLDEGLAPEIELLGISLLATSGVSDLGFVKRLRMRAESAEAGALPEVELIDASPPPGHRAAEPWQVDAQSRADLSTYLAGPALVFAVEVEGTMPARPWSVAMDLCFAARVSYGAGR